MRRSRISLLAAALVAAATLAPAHAGPPLLCFPYQIGQAKSLPWGHDNFEKSSGYDAARVVGDTIEILKTERSVLVRMETLRRAAIYIGQDTGKASELLSYMTSTAVTNDSIGKVSPMNLFDAGFFAATVRQNGVDLPWHPGADDGVDGYLWVKRATDLLRSQGHTDPEMEFGAALVIFDHNRPEFKDHLRNAVAGAKPGSDLAASIESNWACGHKPVAELKKELGDARADAKPAK
jgi:hypothetical protein